MVLHKRHFIITAFSLLFLLIMSSCGSSTTTTSNATSPQSTATTPPTPTTASTVSATPTQSSGSAVIKTATATINGKSETILTDTHGMTLYYFTPDTATTAACTGGCASTWPPLLFTGSGSPTASTTIPGTLTVASNANGQQVLYNKHFLYTFSGDTAPGQTNGEGIGGKWFVATTTLGNTTAGRGY